MVGLGLQTVSLETSDRTAWITLNRPDSLNAWTPQLARDLLRALDQAGTDPEIRCVVLRGAGRAFSSGADLKAGELGEDVAAALRELYHPVMMRVRTLEQPVIAAVHGAAAGIGCALALAADLVIAAESAFFLFAFANVGLALDGGASVLLSARVGYTRASEIALLADRIPAETAARWGLANRVVADADLDDVVRALAGRIAAGSPGAHAAIKRTLNAAAYQQLAEVMELEADLQQQRAQSADFHEGVAAFLQKRPPAFTGG